MRTPLAVLILLWCVPAPALAQEGNWQNLTTLRPGDKITVVDSNMKSVQGTLVHLSDRDITVRVGEQEQPIPREQVYRVARRTHRRNALIGFAIGAGAGFLTVAISPELGTGNCSQGTCFDADIAFGMALLGGGIGAGIGAAIPHTATIYRAAATPAEK